MSKNQNQTTGWKDLIFIIVSWALSIYFLVVFHLNSGFPPLISSDSGPWIFLAISLILFALPFVSSIRIGDYFEIRRDVERVNEKVEDFREEVRSSINVISSSITAISNVTVPVNINMPGFEELLIAQEKVREVAREVTAEEVSEVKKELLLDDEETILPLARTRIRVEQLLRKILRKRLSVEQIGGKELKYLSARSLFRKFLEVFPENAELSEPFDYVMRVCNAAIHGQRVRTKDADIALDIGADIIAYLSDYVDEDRD